jgi:hypothetical protein
VPKDSLLLNKYFDNLLSCIDEHDNCGRHHLLLDNLAILIAAINPLQCAKQINDQQITALIDLVTRIIPTLDIQASECVYREMIVKLLYQLHKATGSKRITKLPQYGADTESEGNSYRQKQRIFNRWCTTDKVISRSRNLVLVLNKNVKEHETDRNLQTLRALLEMMFPYACSRLCKYSGCNDEWVEHLHETVMQYIILVVKSKQDRFWKIAHQYLFLLYDHTQLPDTDIDICIKQASNLKQPLFRLDYFRRILEEDVDEKQLTTVLKQTIACNLESVALLNKLQSNFRFDKHREYLIAHRKSDFEDIVKTHGGDPIAAQTQNTQSTLGLLEALFTHCRALLGPAPCETALLIFGSNSIKYRLPFSDAEGVCLHGERLSEEGGSQTVSQVRKPEVTHYVHTLWALFELMLVALGETPDNRATAGQQGLYLDNSTFSAPDEAVGTVTGVFKAVIAKTTEDDLLSCLFDEKFHGGYALLQPVLLGTSGGELFDAFQKKVTGFLTQQTSEKQLIALCKKLPSWQYAQAFSDTSFLSNLPSLRNRETIALFCLLNVLDQREKMLENAQAQQINFKQLYSSPLTYLALNLKLFYLLKKVHPYHILCDAHSVPIRPLILF